MSVIPALIGAAAAVAPTIYGIVDDHQRRKKDEKEKTKAAIEQTRVEHYQRAGVPVVQVPEIMNPAAKTNPAASSWPEWALPVAITGGVILFGTLTVLALTGNKEKSKTRTKTKTKTRTKKEEKVEEENDE